MIQLSKGGNINLAKEANGVTEFSIGLGWDVAAQAGVEFDLDVAAIPLNAQDKADDPDAGLVFYNNPNWKDAIKHSGDNRTGAGAGDDETIVVDTTKVPASVEKIIILVNIHDAKNRQQNFGMVNNAYCNLYAKGNTTPLAKFDLTEDASMSRCIVFCQLYRHNGDWKFKALGEDKGSYQNAIYRDILRSYGFILPDAPAI